MYNTPPVVWYVYYFYHAYKENGMKWNRMGENKGQMTQ